MVSGSLTDALRETLALFDGSGKPWTTSEVADRLDLGRRSTYERLERLVDRDRLETKKVGASARVWWRPPSAVERPACAPDSTATESLVGDDGEVVRAVVAAQDTARLRNQSRRLERQRDDLERELDEVYRRVDDGVFALDDEFRVTYINERGTVLFGTDEDELVGRRLFEVIPEIVDTPFEEETLRTMRTRESTRFEAYYGPTETWFEASIYPSETGVSVYVRDVTGRKKRQRELEESRRRLQTLVDNFPNGAVVLVDRDLQFVTVGGTPLDEANATVDQLEGRSLREVLPQQLADLFVPRYADALDGTSSTFERDVGDRTVQFRIVPVRDDDGAVVAAMGMSQDVTERKRYEQALERRVRQLEAVTDLGTRALQDRDLDALMAEAADVVATVLGNEYCKVLDLDADAERLLVRQGAGWEDGTVGSATVSSVEDDSQAAYTLEVDHPVVVEDLEAETRFSGPELLTSHDVRSGISVVIGPQDDPWGILGTHDTDRREFSDHDVNFVQSVANILAGAIVRTSAERELLRQRDQLATLNTLSEVVHEITGAVIDRSTRGEIEETVCEHLVATDSYTSAWIGDGNDGSQPGTVRTSSSEAVTDGPFGTDESGDRRDQQVDGGTDPGRVPIAGHEAGSSTSIPIVHEEMRYGVLHVRSGRPNAFEGQEEAVLDRLGEVVGHAIAASERKQALMSDEVVELQYRIEDVFASFGIGDSAGRITLDHAVPITDDEFLVYGSATAAGVRTVRALVETVPHWVDVQFRDGDDDTSFELRLSEPPVLSVVASIGGTIEEAVIEGDDFDITIRVAPGVDVREITGTVRDKYPEAELLSRRQITRPDRTRDALRRVLTTGITERQQVVLRAAYHAGYFDWPREASGEDIAESLDISPPTFHQHLRSVERNVFESLLSGSTVTA